MLKYGRNEKMTFSVSVGRELQKLSGASLFSLGESLNQILSLLLSYLLPYEMVISSVDDSNATDFEWRKKQF